MGDQPAGLYLDHKRCIGLEATPLPDYGTAPSTVLVVSDGGPGGLGVVRRHDPGDDGTELPDRLIARIAPSGNMYVAGSLEVDGDIAFTGGVYEGSLAGGPGSNARTPQPWEAAPGGRVLLKDAYQRVGIGTDAPRHALHVVGGDIAADALHGRLSFADLTHVPAAGPGSAGLVRLSDATDLADSGVGASARALRDTHAALAARVSKLGDTMQGSLHVGGGRLTVSGGEARLGVGRTDPAHSLDVTGDINFTGRLLRNGAVQDTQGSVRAITDGLDRRIRVLETRGARMGRFVLRGDGDYSVSGLAFEPAYVKFWAHTTRGQDRDVSGGAASSGTDGYAGSSFGYAKRDGEAQAVHSGGGTGAGASFFSSSSVSLAIRYADPDGMKLGLLRGEVVSFAEDGFTLRVTGYVREEVVMYEIT